MKKKECSVHKSKGISGFCFECSVCVCFRCLLGNHSGHSEKVSPLEESVLKRREQVVNSGADLEYRLETIEKKNKRIDQDIKELEEKLEKKRTEKKDLRLEKEDLRIRQDSIIRLSNTPSDISLFDEELFSTLLETAKDIVNEGMSDSSLPKKGHVCCDDGGVQFVSSFRCDKEPSGLSVNSDGNFLISENGSLRVRDKEGRVVGLLQKAINVHHLNPLDVAIGLDDQIVVLDWLQSRVVILNNEGELVRSFGSKGSQPGQFKDPYGVAVDQEGRIVVADTWNDRIQVFSNDGTFIRSFGSLGLGDCEFNRPQSVAVDRISGYIVVPDCWNHRIQVLDIEGNLIRCFGSKGPAESQLNTPRGLDVDGKGRIIVAEWGNERVSVFDKDGTFLFSFGKGHLKGPCGVVVDSSGSIMISDYQQNVVQLWN